MSVDGEERVRAPHDEREECARERAETGRPDPRIGIPDHYSTPPPVRRQTIQEVDEVTLKI